MTTVTKIERRGSDRPPCRFNVDMTMPSANTLWRKLEAERRGLPVAVCGVRAYWTVGGVDLCQRHAGETALRILAEQGA